MDRRDFLKTASLSALAAGMLPAGSAVAAEMGHAMSPAPSVPLEGKAEHTLRIATGVLELAPERFVSTTMYNGDFPGPLLRLKQGQQTSIDVFNDTDHHEQVHFQDRKSTRLNSSHPSISYAVFCLKKKKIIT